MSDEWKRRFDEIHQGAEYLKGHCLNRNDKEFAPWREMARKAVSEYAPKKIPSFDEIRFASDYFLSKSRVEQNEINDRIALFSDIDLFIKMVSTISDDLRKKSRQFVRLDELIHEDDANPQTASTIRADVPAQEVLRQVREKVRTLSLSRRDEEEVFQEIDRVERELGKPHPDWDHIKRAIKFFLDFDRRLAQEAIPRILSLLPKP